MSKKKSKIKVRPMEVVALGICKVIKTKKKYLIATDDLYTADEAISDKDVKKFLKKHKDLIVKVKASKCDDKSQGLFEDKKVLKFVELDAVAIMVSKLMIKPKKIKTPESSSDTTHSVSIEIKGDSKKVK